MTVGTRIKQRREEIGMSVDEFAAKLGKNRATVYRYERGDIKRLPLEILEPISNVLGVSPGYFMGWTESEPKPRTISEKETVLTEDEQRLLDLFRQLPPKEQGSLLGRAELLVEQRREAETEDAG